MTHRKDPSDRLDYVWDFSAFTTDGDTITSHTITADPGITANNSTHTDTHVTVWVSGGTAGQTYAVTCNVATAAGRIIERTEEFHVRDL